MIDVRDIVDSAVAVLTASNRKFVRKSALTGPESIGFADVALCIGQAVGKPVRYAPVPHEATKQSMLGMGMPE